MPTPPQQKITPIHFVPKFCTQCGHALAAKFIEEEACERLHCSGCGYIAYLNPFVVAGAVPFRDDKILLLRRGIEPMKGRWTFPAGFVELGETVSQGAAREAKEETGIDIQTLDVLGVYSYMDTGVVVVVYFADWIGGEPAVTREAMEIQWFTPHEIPWAELAFRSTQDAMQDWCHAYNKQRGLSGGE